jgi:aerobic carbon-monoxide dehydrogenase medium subunit
MSPLVIAEPASTAQACDLLAAEGLATQVLAGGTAVVLMMRQGLIVPERLVALWRVPGLRGIEHDGQTLRIGASTTLTEVAASADVRAVAPSLAHACSVVGNPRVRNVATLGGNLAEADYASDPPTALASLHARCVLEGPTGTRRVDVRDLITGFYSTVLEDAELITGIEVPLTAGTRHAAYLKYRSRSSEDRACVGVGARVEVADGCVREVDVAVAAVASTPQRVPQALADAVGRPFDARVVSAIARAYAGSIEPIDDARGSAGYRRRMIEVWVRRTLDEVAGHRRPTGELCG